MASISAKTDEKMFTIRTFLGLNENIDGDAKLKIGEASEMRNWRITREGSLKRRPGTRVEFVLDPIGENDPVVGLWSGIVRGREEMVAACSNTLYRLYQENGAFRVESIGPISTARGRVLMFPFNGDLYIIDGVEYYKWNGDELSIVQGDIPCVAVAVPPSGGGELMDQVNKLSSKRRVWISPDGVGTTFTMPEPFVSVDEVKDLRTNTVLNPGTYHWTEGGTTVRFDEVFSAIPNSYEIQYSVANNFRSQIVAMKYAELYSGTQDTRVFLYGDGSNEAFYSGLVTDTGLPSAEYFPDQNEVAVGDKNTPITSMIRHYSSLVCYKTDSTWSINFGITTLDNGSMIPAFYCNPINRIIGNVAVGQVQLLNNDPVTLFNGEIYSWKNNSYQSNALTGDERQAQRISDRIHNTFSGFNAEQCICYDDNANQEYYIACNGNVLVLNYAANVWYYYTGLDITSFISFHGELFFGSSDGKIRRFSEEYLDDDGDEIEAYWESGSMDFGQGYRRKNCAQVWIGLKPDADCAVNVTVQTDRKAEFSDKIVSTDRVRNPGTKEPLIARQKLKAKKFTSYKLILKSDGEGNAPTVVSADIRVTFAGYTK